MIVMVDVRASVAPYGEQHYLNAQVWEGFTHVLHGMSGAYFGLRSGKGGFFGVW